MPATSGIGLEGPGIVIFASAILAALVLLDIGFVRGRWGFVLDAPADLSGARPGCGGRARVARLGAVVGVLPAAAAASPGLILALIGVGLFLYGAGTGLGTRRTF